MLTARKESWLSLMLIVTVEFPSFYMSKGLSGENLYIRRMARIPDGIRKYNHSSEATEKIRALIYGPHSLFCVAPCAE